MSVRYPQPRDAAIKVLYERGDSYQAIEKELDIPRGTLCGSISRMIERGEIKPRNTIGVHRNTLSFGQQLKLQAQRGY